MCTYFYKINLPDLFGKCFKMYLTMTKIFGLVRMHKVSMYVSFSVNPKAPEGDAISSTSSPTQSSVSIIIDYLYCRLN